MLGRYNGPIVLREPEKAQSEAIVPRNYPRKLYPTRRNKYGVLLSDHKVTLEEEINEIRTRHALRREYNRSVRVARRARQALQKATNDVTANYSALDEPDA